jgi:hypothetical protein
LLLLLPPPGTGSLARPSPPEGLGTARFSSPVELKKRRSAPTRHVWALVQLHPHPPPPNHRPGQLAAHIALGITWGGLVAGGWQGPPKGPIARTKKSAQDRGPPGGRGVRGPDFVLRKPLDTYLGALKPACGRGHLGPGPAARQILASTMNSAERMVLIATNS